MASNLNEGVTPVDRVPAFITAFSAAAGSYGPGCVDVDVSAGSCVLTVGRGYASLDRQAVLDLAHALSVAARLLLLPASEADQTALDHARQMVESLGLTFPAGANRKDS